MFGTDPKEGMPVPQFYDQPTKPEAELTGSGDLFGTPLKAPKTAFLLPQLIEIIRTVDSNRNRQALRYPSGAGVISLLNLPCSICLFVPAFDRVRPQTIEAKAFA
jgi:hypothetical protein